jgi:hypothetical protein
MARGRTWYPQGHGRKFLSDRSNSSTQSGQHSSSSSSTNWSCCMRDMMAVVDVNVRCQARWSGVCAGGDPEESTFGLFGRVELQ